MGVCSINIYNPLNPNVGSQGVEVRIVIIIKFVVLMSVVSYHLLLSIIISVGCCKNDNSANNHHIALFCNTRDKRNANKCKNCRLDVSRPRPKDPCPSRPCAVKSLSISNLTNVSIVRP